MKEINFKNDDFIDLLKNDKFIELIQDGGATDQIISELVCNNPENAKNIKYAIEFIRLAQKDKIRINSKKSNRLFANIKDLSSKNNRTIGVLNNFSKLKIASVVIALIAIGTALLYQFSYNPLRQFAGTKTVVADKSVLILSNGSEHLIANNDSKIDYSISDAEVVVEKNEKEERVQNLMSSHKVVYNQMVVPFGQQQQVVLSDGTVVRLNSGSQLAFPAQFSGKNRVVYLKGEGFFEVTKDQEHPFIVETDYIDIKVFGTTFNVSAYVDEPVVSAVLAEGSVSVTQKNKIFGNQSMVLKPGQGCFYSTSDEKSQIRNVDVSYYTSWKDGVFQFEDMSLIDVVRRVRRYFNVPIQIEGFDLAKTEISGKLIILDEFEGAIKYLTKTVEAEFEKNEQGVYIIRN